MPYVLLTNGFSEEILQTLKPSEVEDFSASDAGYHKWIMIRQIKMRSLGGVIKNKLDFIQRKVIPKWNGWGFVDSDAHGEDDL